MAIAVKIQINSNRMEVDFNKIKFKLPREIGNSTEDFAKIIERNMKEQIRIQRLIWRGKLLRDVQARRLSKNRSVVFVPIHGLYVDSMRPHFVSLKRGRLITQWARTSPKSPWKGRPPRELPASIKVRPHPWIDVSLERSFLDLRRVIRTRLKKGMNLRN